MPKYTDEQRAQFAQQRQAQLKAITEKLEQGITDVYSSDNYREFLKTMSKFTHYSIRNTILIHMQRPDATLVAGYDVWNRKFHRHVKRGEKGIKIYAPVIRKRKETEEDVEKAEKSVIPEDVIDERQTAQEEKAPVRPLVAFKIENVFDVSQTDGEPLPEVKPAVLDSEVADYDHFLDALIQTAKVPIYFDSIEGSANGYYSRTDNRIVVRNDMPEMQTVKTLVHEIAHSRLHAVEGEDLKKAMSALPAQHIREQQAEAVAFVVLAHYGLDAGEYSFPYVAMWAQDKELTELRDNLELIRETSNTLINEIDEQLNELEQVHNADLDVDEGQNEPETAADSAVQETKAAYQIGGENYLEVHLADEGWMFSLYDRNLNEVDGGCYTAPQTVEEAKAEALATFQIEPAQVRPIDYDDFQNRLNLVEQHHLTAEVLPYIMEQDGGQFKLDTAVEPVVTFMESTHPAFRDGMQLPLHLAERFTQELDAEISQLNRGKGDDAETPSVVCRIDYKVKDENHHHHETLSLGRNNGGLMLSMERSANSRIYRFNEHPEEGSREAWQSFVEKHIPVMYQQSMKAENQIRAEVLPEPVPFLNMTLREAMQDSSIGREGYFASHRATLECKEALNAGLERAYSHKAIYQFMDGVNRQFGPERVKAVLAATIQCRDIDGRFHDDTREYANQFVFCEPGRNRLTAYALNSHSVVVDGTMRVCRKLEQQRENARKPSIRKRLASGQPSQKAEQTRQRNHTKKRSHENGL